MQGERINTRRGKDPSGQVPAQEADTTRFGMLLVVLIATYLLSAFGTGTPTTVLQVLLYGIVAVLAARTSAESPLHRRLTMAIVAIGSAIMFAVGLVNEAGKGVANLWFALILLFTALVIVHRILIWPAVTLQSIYGAVSAYLILGLMFAAIFASIDHLGGGHFFVNGEPANSQTFQYFSFTTLTTLGYGDFTAAGASGRAIAILEALTGQIFLVTLIARLVSAFERPGSRR